MSSLLLQHLVYLGPKKPPAALTLEPGLNIICGASDTGKSFLVESLDFMLGGSDPPRDIPERAGYDRIRMLIKCAGWPSMTLERSVEGGNFHAYEEELLLGDPAGKPTILREKHSGARQDTLSYVLLERIGLSGKRIRQNKAGKTRSLSFRDLARLSVVTEEEIQSRKSPFLSGQYTQATPEYAVFKILLTGTDDSALVTATEVADKHNADSGKIELLDQMIEELQAEIDDEGVDGAELTDQISKLQAAIDEKNTSLEQAQGALNEILKTRGQLAQELRRRGARLLEIDELIARFQLLDQHYQTDLNRLEAIHEAGSFFVHLECKACPLCGAVPGDQHLDADCDGNTEDVVRAANAEIEKIRRLKRELREAVDSLQEEKAEVTTDREEYERQYTGKDQELLRIAIPTVSKERASYNELVTKKAELIAAVEKVGRLQRLIDQRGELDSDEGSPGSATATRTEISKMTLDAFSQTVERILKDWHFPDADRVFFDEVKKDFQIAGKERGSSGKGLRAITHAAVSVALLEFCRENDLPHPGFVVLDSPLLAYWKPEGIEDDLRGSDLKERFYEYLLGLQTNNQVIIIENEHPPDFVAERGNVIIFTKNPHQGRYGFFPRSE